MSYLVLARKWRPQRFDDLVGQDVIVRTLKNALSSDHLAHAYLMTGIRGVGKTTISRLMAMAVNCTSAEDGEPCGSCDACTSIAQGNNLDVQEMDAASHTGVDDIREILDGVRYPPVSLNIKVYIIDEAHMLSKSAFNALLKTLEEPPERVLFILATTESDKLPITVRSRCQRFDLRRLNVDEISDYLHVVLQKEAISSSPDALQVIARAADGSVRDALSLTERVLAFSKQNITLEGVQQSLGLIGSEQTQHLADAVLAGNAQAALLILRQAREQGVSPVHLLQSLSERLHEMMCCKLDVALLPQGVNSDTQAWLLAQAACWSNPALDMRYQILIHGLRDISLMDEQRGAEMIAMRLAHLCSISPAEQAYQGKTLDIQVKKTLINPDTAAIPAQATTQQPEKKTLENKPVTQASAHPQAIAHTAATETSTALAHKATPVTATHEAEPLPQTTAANPQVHAENIDPPASWEQAMQQYHNIKPGVAAILEQVVFDGFASALRLHLTPHQQFSLTHEARKSFQSWLNRDIQWLKLTDNTDKSAGESMMDKQQREHTENKRQLWQHAEAEPHVIAIKEAFGCRLVDVKGTSFEP